MTGGAAGGREAARLSAALSSAAGLAAAGLAVLESFAVAHAGDFGRHFGGAWLETERISLRTDLDAGRLAVLSAGFTEHFTRLFARSSYGDLFGAGSVFEQELFLAAHANENHGSPTHRGRVIQEKLLSCSPVPPPPADVVDDSIQAAGISDVRALLDKHAASNCASCHRLTDPIGLLFEGFDQFGRRTAGVGDQGAAEVVFRGEVESFAGLGDFLARLKGDARSRECFVRQLLAFRAPILDRRSVDAIAVSVAGGADATTPLTGILLAALSHQVFLAGGRQ